MQSARTPRQHGGHPTSPTQHRSAEILHCNIAHHLEDLLDSLPVISLEDARLRLDFILTQCAGTMER